MSDRVAYRLDEGVATITMDDGKVNVMSTGMLRDLDAAFDRAEKDQAIALLRSARKDIFSAGFDLKLFGANDPELSLEMVKTGAELALRLMSHPFPTIGIMEGHAFPMGTFLLWRAMCALEPRESSVWASTRLRSAFRHPALRSSWRAAVFIRRGSAEPSHWGKCSNQMMRLSQVSWIARFL